jgi:hypothetical protein
LGLRSSSSVGESLLVFHLLEVKNSLLAEGDVFGEEVVEVVAHARVPNTSSEADNAKNKKTEDKISQSSEEALLLLYRHRRRGRRCPGDVCQSSLGLANIVDGCLADSLGGNSLGRRQHRLLSRIKLGLFVDRVKSLKKLTRLVCCC